MPTLGIAMFTNARPDRVAVVLERPRRQASRIVLAVDDRVDPAHDRGYQALADTVIRVPFPGCQERPVAWLVLQCETDWVLHLDGEEVCSAALVDAIPEILTGCSITRGATGGGCNPTRGRTSTSGPGGPTTNCASTGTTTPSSGSQACYTSPSRCSARRANLIAPLYHADLVLTTTEQRRAKAARYDDLRPDLVAPLTRRGFPSAYYLPELRPDTRCAPVPDVDLAATTALVAPPPRRARRRHAKVVATATIGDVHYWWEMRGLEPVDARAGSASSTTRSPASARPAPPSKSRSRTGVASCGVAALSAAPRTSAW